MSQNGNLPQIGVKIKNIWVATTQFFRDFVSFVPLAVENFRWKFRQPRVQPGFLRRCLDHFLLRLCYSLRICVRHHRCHLGKSRLNPAGFEFWGKEMTKEKDTSKKWSLFWNTKSNYVWHNDVLSLSIPQNELDLVLMAVVSWELVKCYQSTLQWCNKSNLFEPRTAQAMTSADKHRPTSRLFDKLRIIWDNLI